MKKLIFASLAVLLLTASAPHHITTICIIGDSTAALKDLSKGSPERGWGMALQCYFDDTFIRVDNHAEKPQPDRHTDPGSTFDYNLARFVRETREHGGIPVLMNSVVRRNFLRPVAATENADDEALRNTTFKDGPQMVEGDSLVDTHGLYAVAPRDVARRMHCVFVDANRITHDLEQSLGVEGSKRLHMWYRPDEHPALPKGRQDNTHYNAYGAHQVASRLAEALTIEIPLLQKYRTNDNPCKMP